MLRNIFLVTLLICFYSANASRVNISADELDLIKKHGDELNNMKNGLCSICKTVIGWVKDHLPSDPTVEEIKEVLKMACGALPIPTFLCEFILDKIADSIISVIHETPEAICAKVSFCS